VSRLGLEERNAFFFIRPPGETKTELEMLKRGLAAMQKRCAALWGKLGAQEQEFVERKMGRAPVAQVFRKY
jgi:hypothetical protein